LNDINVFDRSPIFDNVEKGNAPRVNFFVNGRPYNMTYYLVDGIYPSYLIFLKLIRLPITEQDTLFVKYQEACRKDVECAFEVLQARYKLVFKSFVDQLECGMAIIMRTCIIYYII
jgi:hypothetical protein